MAIFWLLFLGSQEFLPSSPEVLPERKRQVTILLPCLHRNEILGVKDSICQGRVFSPASGSCCCFAKDSLHGYCPVSKDRQM